MEGSNSKQQLFENCDSNSESADSELRNGGVESMDSMIEITVHQNSKKHGIAVPAKSTFGELKQRIAPLVGLKPEEQRLLFRGKEKNDSDHLHDVGVKNMSKVLLLEDPASREKTIDQKHRDEGVARACAAVLDVRHEVDKLAGKVSALELAVRNGSKVASQEFAVLTELLMRQLLKLDGIEAEGEARVQRKSEVCRIQQYVEKLDLLKEVPPIDPIPNDSNNNGNSISARLQTFDSGMGSLTQPAANLSSLVTDKWEEFE